jgi:hypothetical protein
VRAGVAFLVTAAAAALAGPGWLAGLVAGLAALAALTVAVRRGLDLRSRHTAVAVAGAAALPPAALAGADGVTAALGVIVLCALAVGAGRRPADPRVPARAGFAILLAAVIGLAASAPVLARELGLGPAMGLLALAAAYDAGAYLVGVGATHTWEGPAAGVLAVGVMGFALSGFNAFGAGPAGSAVLVVLFATLAPAGPVLARVLAGSRVPPPLGRLDVLLAAGPIWVWAAAPLY